MNTRWLSLAVRAGTTLCIVIAAAIGARWLWVHYQIEPWTRDGRIRADVVQIGSDVNALVIEVKVADNQFVQAGDVLLQLDPLRYELALEEAMAAIAATQAALTQALREERRNDDLGSLVTTEQREQSAARVKELRAQLKGAIVQRNAARLNLERTVVRASVNGVASNVNVQPGDYAAVGRPLVALLNVDSLRVEGYFEETKLPLIRVGDPALIRLMGLEHDLRGTVESIAAGIEDRDRGPSSSGLANINPSFSWVRLAQRIPVRIRIDAAPQNVRLIAGRTATVAIQVPADRKPEGHP
ncbi:HlyD family efflux transporter periplasmic adaptor subunit [Povalibacter sp.]|uniref:HlyD family efflux transporter periplasmic adaptor subunit n=1 Tax=Povalibacter sp. TaxID=1962978 RepID=UPI002F42AD79